MASPQLLHEPASSRKRSKHGHLLREAPISLERPSRGCSASKYGHPPQRGPHMASSTGRPTRGHVPSEALTRQAPQGGPHVALSPTRPEVPLQPCRAQLSAVHSSTARSRAKQPSGKIYSQTRTCKQEHFMGLFETSLRASHMELSRAWQRRVV